MGPMSGQPYLRQNALRQYLNIIKNEDNYTYKEYLKELKADLIKVSVQHGFSKADAEKEIGKAFKKKTFKERLEGTSAFENYKKAYYKHTNLYINSRRNRERQLRDATRHAVTNPRISA